jgi:hypothetical protein
MAADGISPSIIPTEFCLHLFHHQSRSLDPSIKVVAETNCTEALLATNRIGTFSKPTISTAENTLLFAKNKLHIIQTDINSKSAPALEYSSPKVIFN